MGIAVYEKQHIDTHTEKYSTDMKNLVYLKFR